MVAFAMKAASARFLRSALARSTPRTTGSFKELSPIPIAGHLPMTPTNPSVSAKYCCTNALVRMRERMHPTSPETQE